MSEARFVVEERVNTDWVLDLVEEGYRSIGIYDRELDRFAVFKTSHGEAEFGSYIEEHVAGIAKRLNRNLPPVVDKTPDSGRSYGGIYWEAVGTWDIIDATTGNLLFR